MVSIILVDKVETGQETYYKIDDTWYESRGVQILKVTPEVARILELAG